jgi:anti-sigma B factor antagonist
MSVKLTTHEKGDVTIVDASGKLTRGEATSELRNKLRELVEGGSRRIILNMADVTYIDRSGLGELVAVHTTATTSGGEIKLLKPAKHVHGLLEFTELYTVFETFEAEASATGSFSVAKPANLQARA